MTNLKISKNYSDKARVVLHQGLVEKFVSQIPKNSIRLIVTSPPYNLGKEYEEKVNFEEYLSYFQKLIPAFADILVDGGSICWQVGNYIDDGEIYPLDIFFYEIFKSLDFKLRNRIIWHYGHGLHANNRFSGRYETILWFTKGDDYIFNLDPVRIPSKYPGKRFYKGKQKGQPSGNPMGKNPSDVWQKLAEDWEEGVWDIPNVKARHVEKTKHPCQFPVDLVERCVLALTNESDTVFDPFAGVGSSLIAALKHNRRAIGCEKEKEYIGIARERIQAFNNGTLRLRPLGKPVYQPKPTEKVAQIPDEWKSNDTQYPSNGPLLPN